MRLWREVVEMKNRERETEELGADLMLYWGGDGSALLVGPRGDRRGTVADLLDAVVAGEAGEVEDNGAPVAEVAALFVRGGAASWWVGGDCVARGWTAGVVERVGRSIG